MFSDFYILSVKHVFGCDYLSSLSLMCLIFPVLLAGGHRGERGASGPAYETW